MKKSMIFRLLKQFYFWTFSGVFSTGKFITRLLVLSSVMLLIYLATGCSYFKVASSAYPSTGEISSLAANNKTFVIHSNEGVSVLRNVSIQNDSLTGAYVSDYIFPSDKNTFPEVNSSNRYKKKKGDARVINEIHIYVQNVTNALRPGFSIKGISLQDIYRLDIYNHDVSATTLSWIFGIIGGIAAAYVGFFAILIILMMLGGGSCPYIYVNTGDGFAFAGEIYSGAIYAPLERDDYLTLPALVAENGTYKLKISNELNEIQHTNLTELVVIDHPLKSDVLIDKYGDYQTTIDKQSPVEAVNLTGKDVLPDILKSDSICYYGVSKDQELPLTDGVIMTYELPEAVTSAKLCIRARNSLWLDYVYKNTHELLGSYNDNWNRKQNNTDPEKLREWSLSQKLPLSVFVEKNGEWVFCDYYNMAGPAALKDDVLAIDLKGVDKGPVRIKLESGSFFWEIDYAYIDYSINIPVSLTTVKLDKAVTNEEKLVTDLLKDDDLKYFIQPEKYNVADLSFSVPPLSDSKRTLILHSKGYYHILNESSGLPKVRKLKEIHEPGKFLEYSRELMKAQIDNYNNLNGQ